MVQKDFMPNHEDIIKSHTMTLGVNELHFEYEGTKFMLIDLGGARTERKRWIDSFEGVAAVIFAARWLNTTRCCSTPGMEAPIEC